MIQKSFIPKADETTRFDQHILLLLRKGSGVLQVDFQNYHFRADKGIFLSPGQYLKLVSGFFEIDLYEFEGDQVAQMQQSRFLFKHLVSLGHIDTSPIRKRHSSPFQMIEIQAGDANVLTASINRWIGLNPFRASLPEVEMLFDVKDYVDVHYQKAPKVEEVAQTLNTSIGKVKGLTKRKLETTISKLVHRKLLLEAQRKVAFTLDSTKSIAYELGFSNPTYFNRFFKERTEKRPGDFRENFHFEMKDPFIEDFDFLLNEHYREEHFMGFYADRLYTSVKSLSRKINGHYGCGFNDLINSKIIEEAKRQLSQDTSITQIAYALGFKEPNHLSAFFKKHVGMTPTAFHS